MRLFNVFNVLLVSGHLHSGNVIVESGKCQLLELENWFLGLPSYYRAFFTQFKKINVSRRLFIYLFHLNRCSQPFLTFVSDSQVSSISFCVTVIMTSVCIKLYIPVL